MFHHTSIPPPEPCPCRLIKICQRYPLTGSQASPFVRFAFYLVTNISWGGKKSSPSLQLVSVVVLLPLLVALFVGDSRRRIPRRTGCRCWIDGESASWCGDSAKAKIGSLSSGVGVRSATGRTQRRASCSGEDMVSFDVDRERKMPPSMWRNNQWFHKGEEKWGIGVYVR